MSYPNDAPAAAWYPDPQTPGYVRWWDGASWTNHVSIPANPMQSSQVAIEASVPQIAEADAALHAADTEHATASHSPGSAAEPEYIGRHAAGAQPAPREASKVPRIRPRERAAVTGDSLLSA
ncbi:MAG: DUF2510 domain-containing protein [Pseudolysinimonas sp.]